MYKYNICYGYKDYDGCDYQESNAELVVDEKLTSDDINIIASNLCGLLVCSKRIYDVRSMKIVSIERCTA